MCFYSILSWCIVHVAILLHWSLCNVRLVRDRAFKHKNWTLDYNAGKYTIITDQDKGSNAAIQNVFPTFITSTAPSIAVRIFWYIGREELKCTSHCGCFRNHYVLKRWQKFIRKRWSVTVGVHTYPAPTWSPTKRPTWHTWLRNQYEHFSIG